MDLLFVTLLMCCVILDEKVTPCMPRPFRFGVVIATAPSRTAFVRLAHRAEELGYATLLMPDRTITTTVALVESQRRSSTWKSAKT